MPSGGYIFQYNPGIQFISGVVARITTDLFGVSQSADYSNPEDLTGFLGIYDTVNCDLYAGNSAVLQVVVHSDVNSFSFKLENDLAGTVFTFYTIQSLGLPLISISEIKGTLSEGSNNVSALCQSPLISNKSPKQLPEHIYNPDSRTLPALCGRPAGIAPYSIGEFAGYCHTAKAGFSVYLFNNITLEYHQTVSEVEKPYIVKEQIPVAGDTDTANNFTKFTNIKVNDVSGLNFNNKSWYKLPSNNITSIAVSYWNGSSFVGLQTFSRTITQLGSPYTVTVSFTSVAVALRRAYYSITIQKIRNTNTDFHDVKVWLQDSINPKATITGTGSLGNGGTWTASSFFTWNASDFSGLSIGDTLYMNFYTTYGSYAEENIGDDSYTLVEGDI